MLPRHLSTSCMRVARFSAPGHACTGGTGRMGAVGTARQACEGMGAAALQSPTKLRAKKKTDVAFASGQHGTSLHPAAYLQRLHCPLGSLHHIFLSCPCRLACCCRCRRPCSSCHRCCRRPCSSCRSRSRCCRRCPLAGRLVPAANVAAATAAGGCLTKVLAAADTGQQGSSWGAASQLSAAACSGSTPPLLPPDPPTRHCTWHQPTSHRCARRQVVEAA